MTFDYEADLQRKVKNSRANPSHGRLSLQVNSQAIKKSLGRGISTSEQDLYPFQSLSAIPFLLPACLGLSTGSHAVIRR